MGGSGTRFAGQGGASDPGKTLVTQYVQQGGVTLVLQFDLETRAATIQGRDVSLDVSMREANVILVDDVDSDVGPVIAGTRWVDPELPGAAHEIETIFRRSQELFDYLRCDVRLPEPGPQQMMELLCARMRG